ncbi:MAG: hypothetical protein FH749_02640 [Firmicutes bacterium]|nr:hypothetical protein [Bacillota bacterium]
MDTTQLYARVEAALAEFVETADKLRKQKNQAELLLSRAESALEAADRFQALEGELDTHLATFKQYRNDLKHQLQALEERYTEEMAAAVDGLNLLEENIADTLKDMRREYKNMHNSCSDRLELIRLRSLEQIQRNSQLQEQALTDLRENLNEELTEIADSLSEIGRNQKNSNRRMLILATSLVATWLILILIGLA